MTPRAFRIRTERASLNLISYLSLMSLHRPLTLQHMKIVLKKILVISEQNSITTQLSYDELANWKPFDRGNTETSMIKGLEILPLTSASVTAWVYAEGRRLHDSKIKVREFEKSKEKGGHPGSFYG